MLIGMIVGVVVLAVVVIAVWVIYLDMRNIDLYEKAVKSWLGEIHADCYVEDVMYDFYDMGRKPFDAATEMRAMHYED